MSHVRTQIRDATTAALVAQFSDDATVLASRRTPVEADELPAVLVYTNDEEIISATHGIYERAMELIVEVVAQGADIDDALDALLVRAEQTLNANRLGGLCKPLTPATLAAIVDISGNMPTGRHRLTYRAVYYTAHGDPESAA